MKAPGAALLDLTLTPLGGNHSDVRLLATFIPRGLAGLIYWHAFYPAHVYVFRGMLAGIARAAGAAVVSGPDKVDGNRKNA